jgi:hypothetical protein
MLLEEKYTIDRVIRHKGCYHIASWTEMEMQLVVPDTTRNQNVGKKQIKG